MALTGQQFTIAAGDHEVTVAEVGASLRRYTHGGADVTATYGDDALPPRGCGAVLVPWPNRLRGGRFTFGDTFYQLALTEPGAGNAIHGLGRWARWEPAEMDSSVITMRHDLVPQTGWPFEVRVEVTYAVDAEQGLTVAATARNTGHRSAPFGAGFHPYLSTRGHRIDDVELTVPAAERMVVDDAQIPVTVQPVAATPYDLRAGTRLGSLRLDDTFTELDHTGGCCAVELRTPDGGGCLWFDEAFRFVQVFTLDDLRGGGPAVAVEPMTCAPDAFNSGHGLVVLEPGAQWTGSWGIRPR